MKVYLLFTGDYEQRGVHSVHSTEAEAKAVDARVRRDWQGKDSEPDIEEHELDARLCLMCGYEEHWHIEKPDTWKHPFQADGRAEHE